MGHLQRNRGFSIVEVLVALAIVAILMSMSYSALSKGKTVSKETTCLNNLKQIAVALNLYVNRHGVYPAEDLGTRLAPYVGDNPNLFICPADNDPQGDSYSRFYVARIERGAQGYVCGCPRHVDESSTITLFSSSSAQLLETRTVRWNGQQVEPGTSVGSGVLTFEDGSTAAIPSGMIVRVIQSFRLQNGRLYSVISVPINETGTLDLQVTPGSRFEVVTPAAIAGVQGTRFRMTMSVVNEQYSVTVAVTEGQVTVESRVAVEPSQVVSAGQTKQISIPREEVIKRFPRRWLSRRIRFADDSKFEAQIQSLLDTLRATTGGGF
jgi:prepilin-type N-terminal cleavage/methylation domain-containing protein